MDYLTPQPYPIDFTPEHDGGDPHPPNTVTPLEALAVRSGIRGDGAEVVVAQVNEWASQLADPATRAEARVRQLARMVAALRARIALNEVLRQEQLKARDFVAVAMVQHLLDRDARTLTAYLGELRAEDDRAARHVLRVRTVVIAAQPTVNVAVTRR